MFNPKMMNKMKKILAIAVLLTAAIGAGAQNMYDAITYSQNHYFGTARSMSMGNAVTALGGDLGSVGINPAGSAVSSYGQFVITPGVTISSVSSAYSAEGERAYGPASPLSDTRMNLPNIGFSMNYRTGNASGVKSVTFSVLSNQTNNYLFSSEAFGSNSQTSKIAEFANSATGYYEDVLRRYSSFNDSDIPWDILTAYQGGMFGPYYADGDYAGVTEAIGRKGDFLFPYVPGALAQSSYQYKRGSKNDLVLNFAANVSDRVYVGVNVGLPTARYRYSETFYESPVNPDLFLISFEEGDTYFLRGVYNYMYNANIDGIYAKFGVIVRPTDALRFGASFQTPTAFTISETWEDYASTSFDDPYFDDSETSPTGEYSYSLRSPYRASFGLAYTFGGQGLFSVDYELADYSVMRFSDIRRERMNSEEFVYVNKVNRYFAGLEHNLRAGVEFKLNPEVAVRAGYTLTTSPERYWTSSSGQTVTADNFDPYDDHTLVTPHYYGDRTQSFAFGLGYSSPGSFFADIAARLTQYPASTFAPYYTYDSYDSTGTLLSIDSPRVLNNRKLWNVSLTLGWRF